MDQGMGNSGSGGMNQGGFYQNNNTYRGAGPSSGPSSDPQGGNFDVYNTPQPSDFQFQGSQSGDVAGLNPIPVQCWYSKTVQTFRRHKLIFLAITLLFAAIFIVKTHDWFITKARVVRLHPNIPIIGFVGIIASFAMCYTYWSIKHPCGQQSERSQLRPTRCPLNLSASIISFQCGPAARASYIRSSISL